MKLKIVNQKIEATELVKGVQLTGQFDTELQAVTFFKELNGHKKRITARSQELPHGFSVFSQIVKGAKVTVISCQLRINGNRLSPITARFDPSCEKSKQDALEKLIAKRERKVRTYLANEKQQ